MANSFSASFEEIWAREQQDVFYKNNVAMKIADTSFNATLSRGDTLNRPYRSSNRIQTYTRGTAITIDDKTDTNEQLSVNREFATGFYLDDFDKIQSKYDIAANYGKDNGIYLSNQVDADVLGEAANATSIVDDGSIGGTSGNSISLSTSNVFSILGAAKRKILKQNVPDNNLFAVVSPEFEEILVQYGAGKDTNMADRISENGFITNYMGFKFYRSNQLYTTVVLSMATQPGDGDTVVINGVTFTFKTSLGSTAGNVAIAGSADAARLNLAELINAPGTTDAGQVALSAANQRLFANATATNDNAADTLTITFKGVGVNVVSDTFTDPTDAFTATKQTQCCLFGANSGTVLVMQREPSVIIRPVQDKLGVNILNGVLYGVKTFVDGAKKLVNVKIKSSSYL